MLTVRGTNANESPSLDLIRITKKSCLEWINDKEMKSVYF